VVTAARSGGTVTLAQGDTLVVALDTQPSTGYRWQVLDPRSPAIVQIGTSDYLPAQVAEGTVGAPGDAVFRFEGRDAGQASLELGYSRPFEKGVAPARTVHYDVIVTPRPNPWLAVWSGKP
jgi:inhibitor of cysteine peptidase